MTTNSNDLYKHDLWWEIWFVYMFLKCYTMFFFGIFASWNCDFCSTTN